MFFLKKNSINRTEFDYFIIIIIIVSIVKYFYVDQLINSDFQASHNKKNV